MRGIFNNHIIKIKKFMCIYVLFPVPLQNKFIGDLKNYISVFKKIVRELSLTIFLAGVCLKTSG